MKTIPSALCIDKETNSQEILTIEELILKDTGKVNLNNKYNFFCNTCEKSTRLSYNSYLQRERSYLSTYPGVEHDDECGIEKIYASTSKTKEILTNKPSSIKNKILAKFDISKSSTKKSLASKSPDDKKESVKSNPKNNSSINRFSLREKKLENLTTEYLEDNVGNYILLYGKVNIYKKVFLKDKKLILKCVANDVFFDIFISSKIQKYLDLKSTDKFTELGFCALLSRQENSEKGYINWSFNLEHSDHIQIIK